MAPHPLSVKRVLSLTIQREQDLVTARQRARHLSSLAGFQQQDQTRIATAVSEIARNAYRYAGGGRIDFSLDLESSRQFLWIEVTDRGPGIADVDSIFSSAYVSATGLGIGLAGSSRLMDEFSIHSAPGEGTAVRFGKAIPLQAKSIQVSDLDQFCSVLAEQPAAGASAELEIQNRDLLHTLTTLRQRESDLERRQLDLARLNIELEETNRGVLALYAELDEKAAALRRADEMKSRFLSHVSHEFRTPVNSVLALTRLLLDRSDGDLTSEQEKQVRYIRDAAQQLADIVNDLLDLAKVDAGKTALRYSELDVNHFLGSIRALMRPLANNEAVSLVIEDVATPFAFRSDESKLGQILRNLISNSLKFTQQGEVRLVAEVSHTGNAVVFSVTDTGIGIAPEDQERIFHEFTQVENPIQKQVKGTGLGLPLSRRLAILLGGTLAVRSAVDKGSVFTLSLPLLLEANTSSAHAPDEKMPVASIPMDFPVHDKSRTILIVDDEAASRYLVHRLFRETPYHLIEAMGIDGAELARFESPSLIFLDLSMPGRTGFEVLDELKSDRTTRDIPVVIHTSKLLSESDRLRIGTNAVAVLPKATEGRLPALIAIRQILADPSLFAAEPEFR